MSRKRRLVPVRVRVAPSFHAVQQLRAEVIAAMPKVVRWNLVASRNDQSGRRGRAEKIVSSAFAAALRRRGWLAAEGYAHA